MICKIKKLLLYIFLCILSLFTNIFIKIFTFKRLLSLFTNTSHAFDRQLTKKQEKHLKICIAIINKISRCLPWRVLCFEQGLMILCLARILKINTNIYFGINKDEDNNLIAHAWTISGGCYITGGESANQFKELYHRGIEI